jgi:hypothetical protein
LLGVRNRRNLTGIVPLSRAEPLLP